MFEVFKKFDDAVERALTDELTVEKLRAIELEALELARLTEPLPNPRLEDLGRYADAVNAAVLSAQNTSREIFVCELPDLDGRTPRIQELRSDPELARVVTYLDNLGLDPRIRTCGFLNGVSQLPGSFHDHVHTSARARKINCLLIIRKNYGNSAMS
jgi:hypothetical protein